MRTPSTSGQIAASFGLSLIGLVLLLVTSRAGAILFVGGAIFGVAGLWKLRRH
jgi:hypothetical protein